MISIKSAAAVVAISTAALISTVVPTSADAVPGFTPDGVNFIRAAGHDGASSQVLSYMNGGNYSPDGVSNITATNEIGTAVVMWTPDGVNQISPVGNPAVAKSVVMGYMNDGNYSPDGVSNITSVNEIGTAVVMWTPDGVNQISPVGNPVVAQSVVMGYMNGGNYSPDGVSNITAVNEIGTAVVMWTPDGVNQISPVGNP
ncbi:MAG: hypothetical protein HQ478_05835, partial [Chloroflexi bacterium]|nr:hypothetical protein [Chloroflexota bacterium]